MRRLLPTVALVLAVVLPAQPASAGVRPAPRASDFTVFGFSQSEVDDEDPQVYELKPDVTIRAIGKWSTAGDEAADYDFGQIARYHRKSEPKQSHPPFAALSSGDQRLVRSLAGVLRVAIGLDYLGAAPVRGTRQGGGSERLEVKLRVEESRPQFQLQAQD